MRTLLLILLFSACSIERPIQAKVLYLTVTKVDGEWTTWTDGIGFEVQLKGYEYRVGDRMPFLITK